MQAAADNSNILIQVDKLSRRYGETLAVNQVSFELHKGEVLGFLGPNGAGKSTTMQMITGNLAPTAGQIKIHGFDIIDEPIKAKSCIGYLPENPPVYRELTVDEYLDYCARLHRLKGADIRLAMDEAKQHCGLHDVSHRLIGNLSKGYQQRVGIAQAIIHRPQVVILDEPTVGLDPIQIREIRSLIKSLGTERSVILSTHILPEVQATCDHVQIIRRGELIYNAPIDQLNPLGRGLSVRVAFRQPPERSVLQQLAGVAQINDLETPRFQIQFEQEQHVDLFVQQAVANDWGLFELIPEHASLEEIFVELTTSEQPAPDQTEAAA